MKKEKMNDKGFSLVELIIVIAIMAVLVVVLAPQYLKYVERSRNSTDVTNATSIVTALQVWAADPDANPAFAVGDDFTITVNATAPARHLMKPQLIQIHCHARAKQNGPHIQ